MRSSLLTATIRYQPLIYLRRDNLKSSDNKKITYGEQKTDFTPRKCLS